MQNMDIIEKLKQERNIPVVIADQQGLIEFVNQCFEEVFQWTAKEIINQPLSIIIPPNLRDAHHLGFSRFLLTGNPTLLNKPLNLAAINKKGVQFQAEHIIYASKQSGVWMFGATIRPLASK